MNFIHGIIAFPMFWLTWLTFLLAGLCSFAVQLIRRREKWAASGLLRHCFPPAEWRKPSARLDLWLYAAVKISSRILGPIGFACSAFAALAVSHELDRLWPHHATLPQHVVPVMLCGLALFLVSDFMNFYAHYLQHFNRTLWELHKVHHSAEFLNPLTAQRIHPLSLAFSSLLIASVVGLVSGIFRFIYGFTLLELLALLGAAEKFGAIFVFNALKHSQFPVGFGPLDHVLLSPHMHQLHHSVAERHWDRNFGNTLSVWDRLFGTMVRPEPGETFVLGTGEENKEYRSLHGVFWQPLQKIHRLWAAPTPQPAAAPALAGAQTARDMA